MEDKKLFMVDANKIYFYMSSMGRCMSIYLNEKLEKYGDGVFRKIPFMKTDSTSGNEYVEMITGTLYYKIDKEYVTSDGLVNIPEYAAIDYSDEELAKTCDGYSLFTIKSAMKFGYKENKKNIRKLEEDKSEKGAKILSKLKRKHGLK